MSKISLKIAYPIILTGLFIIIVFIAGTYDILDANFYIVLIPLTAFLFLFGFTTGQRFAVPVKELLKDAGYLSKGNLNIRFYQENKDELGELAKVFNKIAEDFEKSKSEVKTLDTKVKLRTQVLEGIIRILEGKVKNRTLDFQRTVEDLEKLQAQLKLKDAEISELRNQITGLNSKGSRRKK